MAWNLAARLFALALAVVLTPGLAKADPEAGYIWNDALELEIDRAIQNAPGLPCRLDRVIFKDLRSDERFHAQSVSECYNVYKHRASLPYAQCVSRRRANEIVKDINRASGKPVWVGVYGEQWISGTHQGLAVSVFSGNIDGSPCCYEMSHITNMERISFHLKLRLIGNDVPIVTKENALSFIYSLSDDIYWVSSGPLKHLLLLPHECQSEAIGERRSRQPLVRLSDRLN